jgi:hypothetical protein
MAFCGSAGHDATARFALMLDRLTGEKFWAVEYEESVRGVSFAEMDERISFEVALETVTKLVAF